MILDDAVNRGDLPKVRELLDGGIDPNIRDVVGETPLMAAAWVGAHDIVELLLSREADPLLTNPEGQTALQRLLSNHDYWHDGHDAVVKLLSVHESVSLPDLMPKREIPDSLRAVCREIVEMNWSEEQWAAHEADDWYQADLIDGGFDGTERAFCFSYYSPGDQEWWFQFAIDEATLIASGAIGVLPARRPSTVSADG